VKRIFLPRVVGGFILAAAFSGMVQAQEETTRVGLRVDNSVPQCTFDRTKAETHQISDHTLMGSFAVQCRDTARPYRLTTTLSPFARIDIDDESQYTVRWFIRANGPACDGDVVHPDASTLHSGNRSVDLVGTHATRAWSFCVQLLPTGKDVVGQTGQWPLQGELVLTLTDAERPWVLPDNAERFPVLFGNNSSLLDESELERLRVVMGTLGEPSNYHVQLHAHASLIGDAQYNHDLSIMRLKRVREHLVDALGFDKKDTWGQAWGETRPTALKNMTGTEASENRRVDVILLPKQDAVLPAVEVFPVRRFSFDEK